MRTFFKTFAPVVAAIVVALIPSPDGLAQNAWYFFAIFIAVVLGLILEIVTGLGDWADRRDNVQRWRRGRCSDRPNCRRPGFNAPARAIEWALSGFSNSTVWLAFSAFMFGTAYDRTGLGRRIALSLVKLMGARTLFLGYAVMLSDVILAPFTPSNTARSAGMIFPIIRSLPPLYDSQPNDPSARKIGAYILWTGFATSCVTSSLFLTALAPNLLAIDFIRKAAISKLPGSNGSSPLRRQACHCCSHCRCSSMCFIRRQ